jgi:hypothetical protein
MGTPTGFCLQMMNAAPRTTFNPYEALQNASAPPAFQPLKRTVSEQAAHHPQPNPLVRSQSAHVGEWKSDDMDCDMEVSMTTPSPGKTLAVELERNPGPSTPDDKPMHPAVQQRLFYVA